MNDAPRLTKALDDHKDSLAFLAGRALDQFETAKRGDTTIYKMKDERPEWVHDLVYEAHGDFGPDDWRYECIYDALAAIREGDPSSEDEAQDLAHEFADGKVDIYNGDRLAWLASNLARPSYCDDAAGDGLVGDDADIIGRVGAGQYEEALEVFNLVLKALVAHKAELDEEADDAE